MKNTVGTQLMGIGDEAANSLDGQIRASRDLDWKWLEMRNVQVDGFAKANFHDIPDAAFDLALRKLEESGLGVHCFGSTVMNWAKKWSDPFEVTLGEVGRAIPRMKRLGTKYIRIMSFKPGDEEYRIPGEVFHRVREVTKRFLDSGLQPVHENCMNFGGMSALHAVELLDQCPGLKWLFDTANPILNPDRSKPKPWPRQDPMEFWKAVREHVVHIHVKDAVWNAAKKDGDYLWPGDGDGNVKNILTDAFARGYSGAVSIEPHMVVVFHDAQSKESNEDKMRANFVEYGSRLGAMLNEIRPERS